MQDAKKMNVLSSIQNPKSKIQKPLLAALVLSALCTVCRVSVADETAFVYSYFNTEAARAAVTDSSLEVSAEQCESESDGKHWSGKRYLMDRHLRAGCAQHVGWWAVAGTNCRNYAAGYVGGGAVVDGDGPDQYRDGTWGLDYVGIVIPKRVFLHWWHGRQQQGGAGAYTTDGPRLEHHK
jgi:hypothetical protein